jgi:hypothetical protein
LDWQFGHWSWGMCSCGVVCTRMHNVLYHHQCASVLHLRLRTFFFNLQGGTCHCKEVPAIARLVCDECKRERQGFSSGRSARQILIKWFVWVVFWLALGRWLLTIHPARPNWASTSLHSYQVVTSGSIGLERRRLSVLTQSHYNTTALDKPVRATGSNGDVLGPRAWFVGAVDCQDYFWLQRHFYSLPLRVANSPNQKSASSLQIGPTRLASKVDQMCAVIALNASDDPVCLESPLDGTLHHSVSQFSQLNTAHTEVDCSCSKHRGLCWDKKHQSWRTRIFYAGKQVGTAT